MVEGESRFGEGSEIKRAAPGGTCASLRDRGEARAHRVEKQKWEKPEGAAAERSGGAAKRPSLLPSLAAPWPPSALRSRLDSPRSGSSRRSARRAQNVASNAALALGAGAAGPGRRGAVPRWPSAQAPRAPRSQKQVSARPLSSPPGRRGSFLPRALGPRFPVPDPSGNPETALPEAMRSPWEGCPSACPGQRLLPGDRASASSSAASRVVGRRECPAKQSHQKTPPRNHWSLWDRGYFSLSLVGKRCTLSKGSPAHPSVCFVEPPPPQGPRSP